MRNREWSAAIWSLLYAGLAVTWWAGLVRFPFGAGDIPAARDHTLLGHTTVAAAKHIAAVSLAGAVLAATFASVPARGLPRRVLVAAGWAVAVLLVVLLPDKRVLTALAYAPVALVGAPFGWPPVDFFEVALPWPVLNQVLCIVGGLIWAGATLAFQRRTAGRCTSCGAPPGHRTSRSAPPGRRTSRSTPPGRCASDDGRAVATDSPVERHASGGRTGWNVVRWGRVAAYVAFAVPLAYAVMRWAWALGIRVGIPRAEFDELHATGLAVAGAVPGHLRPGRRRAHPGPDPPLG